MSLRYCRTLRRFLTTSSNSIGPSLAPGLLACTVVVDGTASLAIACDTRRQNDATDEHHAEAVPRRVAAALTDRDVLVRRSVVLRDRTLDEAPVPDDAAIRIVKLASPYAPFPDNIRMETDILHITRTWQFLHGNRLTSR